MAYHVGKKNPWFKEVVMTDNDNLNQKGPFKTAFPILEFTESLNDRHLEVVFGYDKNTGKEVAAFFHGDNLILIISKTIAKMIVEEGWKACQQCEHDGHLHGTDWDKYIPE